MNISTSDKKYILVGSLAVGGMVAYYCMKNHRKSSKSHIPTIVLPMTPKTYSRVAKYETPTKLNIVDPTSPVVDLINTPVIFHINEPEEIPDETPKHTIEESDNNMQILRELESHGTVSFDTPDFHNTDLNSLDHPKDHRKDHRKETNATDDPIILMAMSDNP